uniref:Uncharacterized protein n=1 Tax=Glossina morsitans morsitans TaxID=37546 RepID=A0A1B0FQ32_GLOMM
LLSSGLLGGCGIDHKLKDKNLRCGVFADLTSEHFRSEECLKLIKNLGEHQGKFPDIWVVDGFTYTKERSMLQKDQLRDELCWKLRPALKG